MKPIARKLGAVMALVLLLTEVSGNIASFGSVFASDADFDVLPARNLEMVAGAGEKHSDNVPFEENMDIPESFSEDTDETAGFYEEAEPAAEDSENPEGEPIEVAEVIEDDPDDGSEDEPGVPVASPSDASVQWDAEDARLIYWAINREELKISSRPQDGEKTGYFIATSKKG